MKQTLTVRAIIKQGDKVLLLRRANGNPLYIGQYELPGGKVDFGEDPRAALEREILEETGHDVETLQLQDVYSELDARDPQHQYIILVFIASLVAGGILKIDDDHDKYSWKKLGDIQLLDLTETTRLALQIESSTENKIANVDNKDVTNTTGANDVIIYADGGSRGNPGPSASGFVIKDSSETLLFKGGEYVGITTNNQAEYQAVKFALEKALEMGAHNAKVRLDSLLVVNQLNGIYKIKNRDLWSIHVFIKELMGRFNNISISHVRRELNKEADAMVNKVLDEHTS
jgi:ribonuclease HI